MASSTIAILVLSILYIATPAYSEHPTDNQGSDKKNAQVEEAKAKAKQHVEEAKAKAKQHVEEAKAKQNSAEQVQKTAPSVSSNATTGVDHTSSRSTVVEKLHKGSSFSLVGSGEAKQRDGTDTAEVSVELNLSVFRVTPHMVLLKVTGGNVAIGHTTHDVERGKAVIAMKAGKMILTAQVSDEDGKKTLKLMGNAMNPMSDSTQGATANTHTLDIEGKLAQWSIKMKAEITESG